MIYQIVTLLRLREVLDGRPGLDRVSGFLFVSLLKVRLNVGVTGPLSSGRDSFAGVDQVLIFSRRRPSLGPCFTGGHVLGLDNRGSLGDLGAITAIRYLVRKLLLPFHG
jgi:hypothetical protein